MISDPLKKSDFYLLQADKRLSAGVVLVDAKKKYSLAEMTISKGENYFEKALAQFEEARRVGLNTQDLARRLYISSQKHQEILRRLKDKVDSSQKPDFQNLLERTAEFEKRVKPLV